MQALLTGFGEAVVYAAIAFAWMWVAKLVSDARIRRVYDPDVEIEQSQNLAVSLRHGGRYLGLAVGMLGALSGGEGSFTTGVLEMLAEGAAVVVFLFAAQYVTDVIVVHGIANSEAVRDGNVAVGVVELGVSVATGLVAFGSFAGPGGGLASALVFFALGQVALIGMAMAYEQVTPYRVVEGIRGGNVAAGLMLAGTLVAYGFVLNSSLLGPFLGWIPDLIGFAASAAMGIVLLLLLQWPIDRLFLPGTTLREAIESQRNTAAIAVAVAVKLALALVISAVLI